MTLDEQLKKMEICSPLLGETPHVVVSSLIAALRRSLEQRDQAIIDYNAAKDDKEMELIADLNAELLKILEGK